ncbi:MAG: hypothetical protein ACLGGV_01890 [Bacteroidia bacterium]
MTILKLIYFYGIIITIFNLIWFFIGWLIKLLFADGKNFKLVNTIVQISGIVLLSSIIALQTLEYISQNNSSNFGITLLNIVGASIIYAYVMEKTYKVNLRFSVNIQGGSLKFDNTLPKWTVILALAAFAASIIYHPLAYNSVNKWFYYNIYDIYDTFLLKVIFGIIAIFFVINMISKAVAATLSLFAPKQNNQTPKDDFDDYEIVDEEENTKKLD